MPSKPRAKKASAASGIADAPKRMPRKRAPARAVAVETDAEAMAPGHVSHRSTVAPTSGGVPASEAHHEQIRNALAVRIWQAQARKGDLRRRIKAAEEKMAQQPRKGMGGFLLNDSQRAAIRQASIEHEKEVGAIRDTVKFQKHKSTPATVKQAREELWAAIDKSESKHDGAMCSPIAALTQSEIDDMRRKALASLEEGKPRTEEYIGIVERMLSRYPRLRNIYNERFPDETSEVKVTGFPSKGDSEKQSEGERRATRDTAIYGLIVFGIVAVIGIYAFWWSWK